MNKKSKILIAGHTGMIGSSFLKKLQDEDYKNIICVSSQECDLTNQNEVNKLFHSCSPEYVILAAGKVGGIIENKEFPADFILTNTQIQNNVFLSSYINNVKKLIFFGSSCMYPKKATQPMREDSLFSGKLEETSLSYAVSKLSGLQTCLALNNQLKKNIFLPVIPNSVYGPNDNFDPMKGHVLSSLISKFYFARENNQDNVTLLGSGNPKREFLYVDDLVDACIFLLKLKTDITFPLNIGYGSDITIKELAYLISSKLKYHGEISWDVSKPDGAYQKLLCSSKINGLGWHSKTTLDTGIDNTIKWFINNKV